MGTMQERIASTKKGSITSVQAIYVPADDYTDPGVVSAFAHLDGRIELERALADQGLYPAVDPLASSSRILDPRVVGEEHYQVAQRVQEILQRYRDGGLSDAIAFRLSDGLSWTMGGDSGRTRTEADMTPWKVARGAAGRMPPNGFPRDNRF